MKAVEVEQRRTADLETAEEPMPQLPASAPAPAPTPVPGEAWAGLGRLGEGLGYVCFVNASGKLGEAWGMLGNASGRLGEAWASLGLSQPAERMLLEHFFALLWSSQPASQAHDRLVLSTVGLRGSQA